MGMLPQSATSRVQAAQAGNRSTTGNSNMPGQPNIQQILQNLFQAQRQPQANISYAPLPQIYQGNGSQAGRGGVPLGAALTSPKKVVSPYTGSPTLRSPMPYNPQQQSMFQPALNGAPGFQGPSMPSFNPALLAQMFGGGGQPAPGGAPQDTAGAVQNGLYPWQGTGVSEGGV